MDRAKLGWASNAAAAGARVCSELPEDNPPDHAWSFGECGRGGNGPYYVARELLPEGLFCARNAVRQDPDDFWALVSVAELVLTAHLLGGKETEDDVVQAYARAAAVRTKPDHLTSVLNQLRLFELVGDPPELIDRIRGVFEQRP